MIFMQETNNNKKVVFPLIRNNFDLMKDYCVKRLPDNLINLIPFICYLISLEEDINREIENINSKIIKHDHCYN